MRTHARTGPGRGLHGGALKVRRTSTKSPPRLGRPDRFGSELQQKVEHMHDSARHQLAAACMERPSSRRGKYRPMPHKSARSPTLVGGRSDRCSRERRPAIKHRRSASHHVERAPLTSLEIPPT